MAQLEPHGSAGWPASDSAGLDELFSLASATARKMALGHSQQFMEVVLLQDLDASVRKQTLEALGEVPQEELGEHMQQILGQVILKDSDAGMRARALQLLSKVDPEQLSKHSQQMVEEALQTDSDAGVRKRALEALGKINSEELGKHSPQLMEEVLIKDLDAGVRKLALEALELIQQEEPGEHMQQILQQVILKDSDAGMRARALQLLSKVDPEQLSKHSQQMVEEVLLKDSDAGVRKRALELLRKVEAGELGKHSRQIVEVLIKDRHAFLRLQALHVLEMIRPEQLSKHSQQIMETILKDSDACVRWKALKVLGQIGSEQLGKHSQRLLEVMHTDSHDGVRSVALELLWRVDPSKLVACALMAYFHLYLCDAHKAASRQAAWALLKRVEPKLQGPGTLLKVTELAANRCLQLPDELKAKMAKWQSKIGNTLLHLAAQEGNLNTCRYLVEELDLPVCELNSKREEPRDLAQDKVVRDYLSSTYNLTQTRFGQGDAVQEALASRGAVAEVTWYTKRLPDVAGALGGKHSFLVITLASACAKEGKKLKYILERACPANCVQDHCGVFIGKWETHGPWQGNSLISNTHVEGSVSLRAGTLKHCITMQHLYDLQRELGPYDVASANCHHGAMQAFNSCCKRASDKIPEWRRPNLVLAHLAPIGPMIGLAGSVSFQSGSDSADLTIESKSTVSGVPLQVESQACGSLSPGQPDGGILFPCGFEDRFSAEEAQKQSMWEAAYLSMKVYDNSIASRSCLASATTIEVRNDMRIAVDIIGRSGCRCQVDQLQPGEKKEIQAAEHEHSYEVWSVGWDDICPAGRIAGTHLASDLTMYAGCSYELRLDERSQPIFAQSACVPNVEVLHFAPKTAERPIQWLLARSMSTLFLGFRGTDDLQDAAVDVAAIPLRSTAFGLGVHTGMYATLDQEDVLQEILTELQSHNRAFEPLVLCGHSLGGGYAQILALHLLHGRHVEQGNLKVLTFGAPHVVVPPRDDHTQAAKDLWQRLSSCSVHLVHAWDPVPRLPLCSSWLTDVLPGLQLEKFGFRIGIDITKLDKKKLEEQLSLLSQYDVAGKVVIVGKGIPEARCRSSDCEHSQKDLLSEVPPKEVITVQRLPAYHSMADYLCIAEQLQQAPGV